MSSNEHTSKQFDQELEGLALREQKGVMPPRFVIERVMRSTLLRPPSRPNMYA